MYAIKKGKRKRYIYISVPKIGLYLIKNGGNEKKSVISVLICG
jgi:hypothetical protein